MKNQKAFDEKVTKINDLVSDLIQHAGDETSSSIKSLIKSHESSYSSIYEKISNNSPTKDVLSSAIGFCRRAKAIAKKFTDLEDKESLQIDQANILIAECEEFERELATLKSMTVQFENESSTLSLTEISNEIDNLYKTLSVAKSQNSQSLSDIEEKTNNLRKDLSTISSTTEKMNDILIKTFEEADKIVNKNIDSLKEKQKKAEELLELISRDTISGSYQQSAAAERKMANRLRGLSLLFMILMTAVMGYTLWQSVGQPMTAQNLIFRIAIVMILSIPAAYLAKESSKHRTLENTHHRVSLELKSVDPYLSSLPEEQRNAIKEKLANRVFMGSHSGEPETGGTPISSYELVEKLIEKLDMKK